MPYLDELVKQIDQLSCDTAYIHFIGWGWNYWYPCICPLPAITFCANPLFRVFLFFLLQLQLPAPPFWRLRAKREIVSFLFTKVNYEDSTDSILLETTLISIFQLLSRNRITLMDIDGNFIFKYQFLEVPAVFVPNTSLSPSPAHTHLCEHGFSILCDHSALITVEGDKVIVEGLLGMFQYIVELSGTALKYTPEVPRD